MSELQILMLEDTPTDAELVVKTLTRSGLAIKTIIINGRTDFINAMSTHKFDAILADNHMPQFSAIEALQILKELNIVLPFILVTGSISEEYAVEIMKEGAYDYILKDRLQRLPTALHNALQKFKIEAERRKYLEEIIANEALLKEAARLARFGSWEIDIANNVERWSDEQYRILGYEPGEIEPSLDQFVARVHPEDKELVQEVIMTALNSMTPNKYECRIVDKYDRVKYITAEVATRHENNKLLYINGVIRDISEARLAALKERKMTEDLIQRNNDLEQFTYIISHNLRAPVANIIGISNVVTEGRLDDTDQAIFMKALSETVKKLDSIIVDLHDILQIKDTINEKKEMLNLADIVKDVMSSIEESVEKIHYEIQTDFSGIEEISSLKSYMFSIFYNLISNSIKFRKIDVPPVIEIKSTVNNEKIELLFKDNSIGIDLNKNKDQVFGLYKRFHPDHAPGKGMGLYMVKAQVETLGGKISLQSDVNKGVEFKMEFELDNFVNSTI